MARRRLVRGLTGALLLLPAVFVGVTAARLAWFAWPAAAALGEPVVIAMIGEREPQAALAAAGAGAPLDFSYSRDLAERTRARGRREAWTAKTRDLAWRTTLAAARRAPTDAETRFHLSGLAWRRGDPEEADRQARAALRLAPLYRDLRKRVARWFVGRYDRTRDRAHLSAAIAAMGEEAETFVAGLPGDPRVTHDEILCAFAAARIPIARQVEYLEAAGRWDGAIDVAGEAGSAAEAAARLRLARYLLRTDRREAAFRQVRRANVLHSKTVTDDLLLGRAFLADGARGLAMGAFERHLRGGGEVGEIEDVLAADGVTPADRRALWRGILESGRDDDRARLALARAVVAEGDLATAHRLLIGLVDRPSVGAASCYELARAHREFGDRRVALKYARRAADREPGNERYSRLLRELERGKGR